MLTTDERRQLCLAFGKRTDEPDEVIPPHPDRDEDAEHLSPDDDEDDTDADDQ
jgi:hypothetical protein